MRIPNQYIALVTTSLGLQLNCLEKSAELNTHILQILIQYDIPLKLFHPTFSKTKDYLIERVCDYIGSSIVEVYYTLRYKKKDYRPAARLG